ncbi:MAG TPA: selenoneine biosynthesis selenosugar synthase SenB [Candidatus Dormibacteraeota bacterium]|nr:selenoneine biosynthesis selenosugar synthase SenB [Candidatus Dormibacteraeota bacterium]
MPRRPPPKIALVYPVNATRNAGNHVTAARWASILRELGCGVRLLCAYDDRPYDALIALHARRSAEAAARFRLRFPERPVIVGLAGTDLYGDLGRSAAARRCLESADRLVLLQREGLDSLPPALHAKTRVIEQSARATPRPPRRDARAFTVCVLGNLRHVKDPMRTAMAARLLPPESRVRVVHAGRALDERYAELARREGARNPRYRWMGELDHAAARRLLASSRLLVLSSRSEGGANVISEALVDGVPILAADIAGTRGILGGDYPGLYPVGRTQALAALLARAEGDPSFYARLVRACRRAAPLASRARERKAWRALLAELSLPTRTRRSARRTTQCAG